MSPTPRISDSAPSCVSAARHAESAPSRFLVACARVPGCCVRVVRLFWPLEWHCVREQVATGGADEAHTLRGGRLDASLKPHDLRRPQWRRHPWCAAESRARLTRDEGGCAAPPEEPPAPSSDARSRSRALLPCMSAAPTPGRVERMDGRPNLTCCVWLSVAPQPLCTATLPAADNAHLRVAPVGREDLQTTCAQSSWPEVRLHRCPLTRHLVAWLPPRCRRDALAFEIGHAKNSRQNARNRFAPARACAAGWRRSRSAANNTES